MILEKRMEVKPQMIGVVVLFVIIGIGLYMYFNRCAKKSEEEKVEKVEETKTEDEDPSKEKVRSESATTKNSASSGEITADFSSAVSGSVRTD